MSGDLIFGVKLNGDGTLTGEAKAASAAMQDLAASTQKAASQADQLNASQKATAMSMTQIAEGQMHMSIAESDALDKAWALANGYKEVNGQLVNQTRNLVENAGAHGANAMAIRESMVLVREAARGNWTRMAGSASILTNALGLMPAILSPVGLAVIGVTAAVGGGIWAWEKWGETLTDVHNKLDSVADTGLQNLTDKIYLQNQTLGNRLNMGAQTSLTGMSDAEANRLATLNLQVEVYTTRLSHAKQGTDEFAESTRGLAKAQDGYNKLVALIADRQSLQQQLKDDKHPAKDPNANAVLALQTELYNKQAIAMGATANDVKVYDLARKGANETDLLAAGIAASRLDQIDAENAAQQDLAKTQASYQAALQRAGNLSVEASGKMDGLTQAMIDLAKIQDSAVWQKYTEEQQNQLAISYLQADAAEKQKTATAELVKAQNEAAKKQAEAFKHASDSIYRGLTDALMRAFETGHGFAQAFADTLVNMFKTMILAPTIQFMLSPVTGAITAAMLPGTAAAATGTTYGSMGSFLNAGTAIKSGYDAFTGGLSAAYTSAASSSYGQAMGLSYGTNAQGVALMSPTGSMLGTGLSYAGAGLAGIGLGSAIAGNKSVVGLDGTSISAIGAAVGGAAFGPLGALAGGVIGGTINALFGSGPKVSGATTLAGTFSQSGFAGQYQTPWSKSGGLFGGGSNGVDTTALDSTQQSALQSVVSSTASVFDKLLSTTGDANKSLTDWTFSINQAATTTAEQNQLTIDVANSMGNYLIPALAQFKKTGESLADTATRVTDEFILTDTAVQMMGKDSTTAFGAVGLASAQARDNLVTLMGGVTTMSSTVQSYYKNFYTDSERTANDTKTLSAQFAALGVAMPSTSAGFRALVESQDLSTASGQQMYASLMSLNDSFAALYGTMQSVAAATDAANAKLQALIKPESFSTSLAYTMAEARAIAPASTTTAATPGFASGGDFVGGMRIVGENGPEMEFTGPSRITNNGDSKKLFDTTALVAEIQALRAEVAQLRSSNESTARSSRTVSDLLRRITQDGNSMLTTPA